MSGLLGRRSLSVKIGGKGVEDTIMQSLKLLHVIRHHHAITEAPGLHTIDE